MCAGERIVNDLKALLGDPRHNVLFVGYQAKGTPGQVTQQHGPRGGYVDLDGELIGIRAGIEALGGYSAHADSKVYSTSSLACATDRKTSAWAWRGGGQAGVAERLKARYAKSGKPLSIKT